MIFFLNYLEFIAIGLAMVVVWLAFVQTARAKREDQRAKRGYRTRTPLRLRGVPRPPKRQGEDNPEYRHD
jgi:hypothetical protein